MNKRSCFQPQKKPITCWLGNAGYTANALFRMLGLNDFEDDTSSSSSRWTRNHGGDAQTPLVPVRIPVGRRRYR
jgi:hypothetical protein